MSLKPKRIPALNLEFNDGNELWLTNGYTLRKLIGILGMLLPVLLWFFLYMESGLRTPLESISHYYYTQAGTVFTIIVSLLAIFLIVYKGPKPVDFYLSSTAGLFALCVLLFPTDNLMAACCDSTKEYAVTYIPSSTLSGFRVNFHYISAGIFLFCLACMSLFLFTQSDPSIAKRDRNKKTRNKIFIACGVIMIAALLVIFVGSFLGAINEDVYKRNNLTFWMETVAVEAFGFSWLVKGEGILKDKDPAIGS